MSEPKEKKALDLTGVSRALTGLDSEKLLNNSLVKVNTAVLKASLTMLPDVKRKRKYRPRKTK